MEGEDVSLCSSKEQGYTDGHVGGGALRQFVSEALTKLETRRTEDRHLLDYSGCPARSSIA